jgi:hypothetical protein
MNAVQGLLRTAGTRPHVLDLKSVDGPCLGTHEIDVCGCHKWVCPIQEASPKYLTAGTLLTSMPAGEQGRRIRELTSVVQKRWKFSDGQVELFAEKVMDRGLCAVAQAESLRYKLLGGLAVRRCASTVACALFARAPVPISTPYMAAGQLSLRLPFRTLTRRQLFVSASSQLLTVSWRITAWLLKQCVL